MRVRWTSRGGAQRERWSNPKKCLPTPLHGRAVGWVPTVNFAKHVVREVCEGHAGPTRAGLVLFFFFFIYAVLWC